VKDVASLDPEGAVARTHQVLDASSDQYLASFSSQTDLLLSGLGSDPFGTSAPDVNVAGTSLADLYAVSGAENAAQIDQHLLSLAAISLARDDVSLRAIVEGLAAVCSDDSEGPAIDAVLATVIDPTIKKIFDGIVQRKAGGEPRGFAEIKNSSIGKLAQDIAESLNLNDTNPSDLLDLGKMSGLVEKVGGIITQKLNNKELRQEDLMKDAMNMLKQFGDNPLFAQLAKMGEKTQQQSRSSRSKEGSRERLRRKFSERKEREKNTV
jgi:hypothetical protein